MFVLTLLLIYIVNLNAREILVTKMATKPEFLVTVMYVNAMPVLGMTGN